MLAKERDYLKGRLHPVQIFALRVWLAMQEAEELQRQRHDMEMALISHNPLQWIPMLRPDMLTEEKDFTEDEFVTSEDEFGQEIMTVPNLDGVQVKWTSPPSYEEMEEIFKTMIGDGSGTFGAKDFIDASDT